MTLRNLGQIATRLSHAVDSANACHADVDAFHAPSECHDLVAKGNTRMFCGIAVEIEAYTGYTNEELINEFRQRVSSKWLYRTGVLEPLIARRDQLEKEEADRIARKVRNRANLVDPKHHLFMDMSQNRIEQLRAMRLYRAVRDGGIIGVNTAHVYSA